MKAVFFDFSGTLVWWPQSLEATTRKLAARYGLTLDWSHLAQAREHANAAYGSAPTAGTLAIMQRVLLGYQDFLRELGVRQHLGQLAWEVAQDHHALFSPNNARLYPEVRAALDALRAGGLKLGVISNFDLPLHNLLEALGIEGYFDAAIASHDGRVQCEKTERRIFELALAALGVAPQEAMHVGDAYEADVLGAHAAGLHAVFLDRDGLRPGIWPRTIASLEALPGLARALANDAGDVG